MAAKKKADKDEKALVVSGAEDYAVVVRAENIKELLAVNMEGEDLAVSDLDRAINPSGGSTMFTVPNMDVEDGEEEVKEIVGIIIHQSMSRGYWEKSGVSNDPPDCSSSDMIFGNGTPGGECSRCPFDQFGSATNSNGEPGTGKACASKRSFYVLTEDALLPLVVNAASASINASKKYLLNLTTKKFKKMHEVVTKFTLKKMEKNGNKYAELVLTCVGSLTPDQIKSVENYMEGIKPMLVKDAEREAMSGAGSSCANENDSAEAPVDVPFPTDEDAPPEGESAKAA